MPLRLSSAARRNSMRVLFGIAVVLVAASVGRESRQWFVFALLSLFWISLVVFSVLERRQGRSLGMRLPIGLFGVALLAYLALLIWGP